MAKQCEHCGKTNNSFFGDALELGDKKILCYRCAEFVRRDINNLYYVKDEAEFSNIEQIILRSCRIHFSKEITEQITSKIDTVYKKQFPDNPTRTPPPRISEQDARVSKNPPPSPKQSLSAPKSESNEDIGWFHNIGGKIKVLASVCTVIGIILSILLGVFLIGYSETPVYGILVFFVGPLLSWVSSFFIYGFGQLIENSDKLLELAQKQEYDKQK